MIFQSSLPAAKKKTFLNRCFYYLKVRLTEVSWDQFFFSLNNHKLPSIRTKSRSVFLSQD